jgi:hypothetical protein
MLTYKEFRPTAADHAGWGLPDRQDWIVAPVSVTRDSGSLDQSNFDAALAMLGGESGAVEVHRFGHWGPGWFEIVLIDPDRADLVAIAGDIESALDDYPVLDDDDYSAREFEEAEQAWIDTGAGERIRILSRHGLSIFAARRDEIPQGLPHWEDFYHAR